jgi:hypothetical protein
VVACTVIAGAVAILGLAAALVFYVAPSIAELASAVRAHICECLDSVAYSRSLDAFLD